MATKIERRFAVVLCADVVGYSRLMGMDEEGTLAALNAALREIVDPKILEYSGRTVRTMGDGLLVEDWAPEHHDGSSPERHERDR